MMSFLHTGRKMVTEEDTEGTQQSFTGCIGRSSRKGSSGKSISVNPQEVLLFHHKRTELEFLLRIEGELCHRRESVHWFVSWRGGRWRVSREAGGVRWVFQSGLSVDADQLNGNRLVQEVSITLLHPAWREQTSAELWQQPHNNLASNHSFRD